MRSIYSGALTVALAVSPLSAFAFSDVGNHSQNYSAITYLEENGMVKGYPDGTFRPLQQINRAEFLKIVLEAKKARLTAPCPQGVFPDVSPQDWFVDYTLYAKCRGYIQGYPDGTFRPAQTINFVEAAKIIANVMELKVTPTPVWYEGYVRALEERNAIPMTISSFTENITRGEMAEMMYRILVPNNAYDSTTYEELAGEAGGSSPAELIQALDRTDWTDQGLMDRLCRLAGSPEIIAITDGQRPDCDLLYAGMWHEWLDLFWPEGAEMLLPNLQNAFPNTDHNYVLIFGTFNDKASADAYVAKFDGGWVLDTNLTSKLTPGLFAAVYGPFSSMETAKQTVIIPLSGNEPAQNPYAKDAGRFLWPEQYPFDQNLYPAGVLQALLSDVGLATLQSSMIKLHDPDEMGCMRQPSHRFTVHTMSGEMREGDPVEWVGGRTFRPFKGVWLLENTGELRRPISCYWD